MREGLVVQEFGRLHCVLPKSLPEGQYQRFLDIVSYLQFVTDEIIDVEMSQSDEIQKSRVWWISKQSDAIASFHTHVPRVFAGPKESCDSRDPLSGLKTTDNWNLNDPVHVFFTRDNKSLKVKKRKLHATISRELSVHNEAESLAYALFYTSDLCWENLNYNMEGFYHTLIKTTYGNKPTNTQTCECWKIVKLMVRVFLKEPRKARVGEETAHGASGPHMRV